jgi:hypothetical protein
LSYALGALAVVVLLGVGAGIVDPSQWRFSAESNLAASLAGSSGATEAYFGVIFTQGVDLIRGFFDALLGSFSVFFGSGLIFILHLLHLG